MRERLPCCPRCRYDLSGQVATWEEICPLIVQCSECGHEMPAARAFTSRLLVQDWSFEHGDDHRISRWARTSVRTLFPGAFWRAQAEAPAGKPQRLLVFVLCWAGALIVAVHLGMGVHAMAPHRSGGAVPSGWNAVLTLLWPYAGSSFMLRGIVLPFVLWILLPPLFLWLVLSLTCLVRPAAAAGHLHLLRGLCYSIPVPVLVVKLYMAEQARNSHFPYKAEGSTYSEVYPAAFYAVVLGGYIVWLVRWWVVFPAVYLQRPRLAGAGMLLVFPALVFAGVVVLKVSEWLGV